MQESRFDLLARCYDINKVKRVVPKFSSWIYFVKVTVYRKIFVPVLFSPSDSRVNLKLGEYRYS